jgi:hypothetical protein
MERYGADVLVLGIAVCLATGALKKMIPSSCKKYLTFAPFVIGCVSYGVYMLFTDKNYSVFSEETVIKGFQCGGAATIYYVLFEQFIRGKKTGVYNIKELTVAGILKDIVAEDYLYSLSVFIARQTEIDNDVNTLAQACLAALSGKTLPGITESDVAAAARLVALALQAIK